MPNRIIKESVCTSDTIDRLTAEEERFFYRLIVQADDFGRFDGRAPVVLAGTFPLRAHEIGPDQVEAWLQRLADVDLIRFYYIEGRRYLYFTTWDKHQQKRAKNSKFPDPIDDEGDGAQVDADGTINQDVKPSDINCNQRKTDDGTCPRESRIREYENTRSETRAGEGEPSDPSDTPGDPRERDSLTHSSGMPEITTHYHKRIGMLGPKQYEKLRLWHEENGMDPDLICHAIDTTVKQAEKPGMAYLEAVLRNWYNDGVSSLRDLEKKQRARSPTPSTEGRPNASAYVAVGDDLVNRWKALYPDEYD